MSSLSTETASALDLNDSGCVQDSSMCENGYKGHAQLLDLSDDVLLFILKYCSPRDLKALGFTCTRLAALISDHTLWNRVDCRDFPTGQLKLRWLLTHCLSLHTTELKIKGYVNANTRCMGMENFTSGTTCQHGAGNFDGTLPSFLNMPRFSAPPGWPDSIEMEPKTTKTKESSSTSNGEGTAVVPVDTEAASSSASHGEANETASSSIVSSAADRLFAGIKDSSKDPNCPGPQFTLTLKLMQELKTTCGNLTSLYLEYCDINCKTTNLSNFPRELKKLSLRGSRCFNQPLHLSYFGKVHDYLLYLEYLDVSYCEWFEPASLMPLSKLPYLQELHMRGCERLTECVAYTSLAARYGFHQLRVLDVRESPLADSEVSAFGWLPRLQELRLAPAFVSDRPRRHTHRMGHVLPEFQELDPWELQEPEYYKRRSSEIPDLIPEEEPKPAASNGIAEVLQRDPNRDIPWEQSIIVIQPNANREMMIQPRILPAPPMHPYAGPSKRRNVLTPLNLVKRRRRAFGGMGDNDPNSDEMTWTRHSRYYDLITDSAVLMFGRGENEHIVHIGVGPPDEPRMRPDRSSLRVLSMPGFRNITNRSLEHLATAAPYLRLVDFSGTSVTEKGVEIFKALKPDCEIKYSKFVADE